MRRLMANALLALGFTMFLWSFSGCGSQESVSERRKRVQKEVEAGVEPAAESTAEDPAAAEGAAEEVLEAEASPEEGDEAAVRDPGAEEEPAEEESAGKVKAASKGAKTGAKPAAGAKATRSGKSGGGKAPTADEEVLDEMREDLSFQAQEAQYYVTKGDEYFQQSRYREAVEAYRQALDLDPSLDPARERYNDAQLMLDERVGTVGSLEKAFRDEQTVLEGEKVAEIRRNVGEARKALEEKDLDEAERKASRAVDYINITPDFDPAEKAEAQALLDLVREQKKLSAAERQAALQEDARTKAEQDLREQSKLRYRQTQELLRKAMELIRLKDYEKTIEVCERVVELDPDNRVARFWLADARDQMLKQRRLQLIEDRIENQEFAAEAFAEVSVPYNDIFVFPDDEAWQTVRTRSEAFNVISVEDPEPIRRIKNALDGTTIDDMAFDATPLEDVVLQLRKVTGARIMIDPQIDAASQMVTMRLQGIPAVSALNLILESLGLTYTFKENVLFITNPGGQTGAKGDFAIYNVADLLNKIRDFEGPELMLKPQGDQGGTPISFTSGFAEEEDELDPDSLVELVKESTGGADVWTDPPSITFHQGQFLVEAPRDLHVQVQNVLSNLRQDSDLFVVIEARFIDVADDFLEDIGVDMRALGVGSNLGIPFGNVINDNSTGGQDLGFVEKGDPLTNPALVMGQDRWAGRLQNIIDGFTGTISGDRLSGGGGVGGLTLQSTWLEPFQINVIFRAVQERQDVRELTAPVVTAHNGQRVYVSVITQRAYIADYNLVSGGTGFAIIEVADPEVQTFQEGVILDVDPVISHDKKYITLDVKPTLATLIGGVISTILVSLGSFTNVAFQVPIGVPEIALQQSFTSVTVPNGGTVLLGGFKSLNEGKFISSIPILGKIPLIENLFRRQAVIREKRSLVILITARIVDLRGEEARRFNSTE